MADVGTLFEVFSNIPCVIFVNDFFGIVCLNVDYVACNFALFGN